MVGRQKGEKTWHSRKEADGDDDCKWVRWRLVENDVSFKFGDGANFGDNSSQRLQPTHWSANHPYMAFRGDYEGGKDYIQLEYKYGKEEWKQRKRNGKQAIMLEWSNGGGIYHQSPS